MGLFALHLSSLLLRARVWLSLFGLVGWNPKDRLWSGDQTGVVANGNSY